MVDAARLGAWLRSGEGIGWLAAGTIPNSLYRLSSALLSFFWHIYVYFVIVPSFLSFLFCFVFCSRWSFVDVPLIFSCPADHVPDLQPRVLLGMVEARSVNVKKTTTTVFTLVGHALKKHAHRALNYTNYTLSGAFRDKADS